MSLCRECDKGNHIACEGAGRCVCDLCIPYELRGLHRHRCSVCGSLDADAFGRPRQECNCPWPRIDVLCTERVPGARNWECPSLTRAALEPPLQELPLQELPALGETP
jgi:hypothetical protein